MLLVSIPQVRRLRGRDKPEFRNFCGDWTVGERHFCHVFPFGDLSSSSPFAVISPFSLTCNYASGMAKGEFLLLLFCLVNQGVKLSWLTPPPFQRVALAWNIFWLAYKIGEHSSIPLPKSVIMVYNFAFWPKHAFPPKLNARGVM